jgi:hypothetical protein
MLNHNGGANIVGASDIEGGLRPPPPPHFPTPAEEDLELRPSTASPYSQFVNRDWRWGDARNSTELSTSNASYIFRRYGYGRKI